MEKILDMLRKAMENARILAIVQFDPELFLFTSALQSALTKGLEYQRKKKKTAAVGEFCAESQQLLTTYHRYLSRRSSP